MIFKDRVCSVPELHVFFGVRFVNVSLKIDRDAFLDVAIGVYFGV